MHFAKPPYLNAKVRWNEDAAYNDVIFGALYHSVNHDTQRVGLKPQNP